MRHRFLSSCRRSRIASSRSGDSSIDSAVRRTSATTSSTSLSAACNRSTISSYGAPPVERAERAGQRIACATVVGERRHGLLARLAEADRIAEQRLLGVEPSVLVGVDDVGPVEFVELVAQQVDLPRPHALVAAERGQFGVDLGEPGARGTQRFEVDPAEPVECGPLRRGRQQALVGVLAVEVDQARRRLGERRDRREPAVHVGARPPVAGDDPAEHQLVAGGGDEPTVDARFVGPVAHHGRVGPPADEQFDRLDEHRLARPGLAGHHGQPVAEDQLEPLDHAEVLDVQLSQHSTAKHSTPKRGRERPRLHGSSMTRGCHSLDRSVRPNLAFRIWW